LRRGFEDAVIAGHEHQETRGGLGRPDGGEDAGRHSEIKIDVSAFAVFDRPAIGEASLSDP